MMKSLEVDMHGLKTDLNSSFKRMVFALLILCFVATGCTLAKLKEDVAESLASTALVGQVATASPERGVIVVAAYSLKDGEREIAHYTVLH